MESNQNYQHVEELLVMRQAEFYDAQQYQVNQAAREASETIFLKKFNNFIKTLLINQFCRFSGKNLSVLDLCCGRGGDLGKWAQQDISHYVGLDLSNALVEEAQRRYFQTLDQREQNDWNRQRSDVFKAIFIVADASDENNLIDKVLKQELKDMREKIVFDIVSTQFAIHYFFESEQKLRAYFMNVTDRLEAGSFFVGTTIDSDELVSRIREEGKNDNTIQNDFYKVVLPQDTFSKDKSPFGLKYYFYLMEAIGKETQANADKRPKMVDEYLVIFDKMVEVAAEFGLKLVMKKNLKQYYDDMCSEEPQSMKFTQYDEKDYNRPPPPNVRQYNRRLFQNKVANQMQDTNLSQDQIDQQFEICGLYCVFVFQKEGKRYPRQRGNFKNRVQKRPIVDAAKNFKK